MTRTATYATHDYCGRCSARAEHARRHVRDHAGHRLDGDDDLPHVRRWEAV
ncbi:MULTISPECIES: hypothetical protein [Streptomyces]|uniref:hypothetical protein n=1 Tax=Streptomyces TaxID=1883 RepID=UPI000AE045EC